MNAPLLLASSQQMFWCSYVAGFLVGDIFDVFYGYWRRMG
jgi:hypothetical protein